MKNKIIQTIWFEPMKHGSVNPYLHLALAYVSAKSIKEQGYELVCYTDRVDILEGFPYDYVIELDMSDYNPGLFDAIKYKALEKEPLGIVHLDYDILLSKPCIDFSQTKDILVQSIEQKNMYLREREFVNRIGIPCGIKENGLSNIPYCFGVIGFFSNKIKEEFLRNYNDAILLYKKINIPKNITLDYLFEQAYLPKLVEKLNNNVATVVDYNTSNSYINGYRYTTDINIGFTHYSGKSKWQEEIIKKITQYITNEDKIKIANAFCKLKI